jgi:hypothetical protein
MTSKECRICFDDGNQDDMIAPCRCSGSSKYVHRKCLDTWRSQDPSNDNFSRCNQCRFTYVLEDPSSITTERDRRERYETSYEQSVYTMFLSFIFSVIVITILIKALDYHNNIDKFYQGGHFILAVIIALTATSFMGNSNIKIVLLTPFLIFGFSIKTIITSLLLTLGLASFNNGSDYINAERDKNRSRIWLLHEANLERIRDLDIM